MKLHSRLFLCFVFTAATAHLRAQTLWPSPEVEQMYHNAREAEGRGNYKDATTIYKQALVLMPGNMQLSKALAGALTKGENYTEAGELLHKLTGQSTADAECFSLLAQNEAASGHTKKAIHTVTDALVKFTGSGILYHELGNLYQEQKNRVDALSAWLDGLEKDPAYSENYRDAALVYLRSTKLLWGLLYAEQYLNLPHDTTGDEELKLLLYAGYKGYFNNTAQDNQAATAGNSEASFEEAVSRVYSMLTPVVSDGIDVESLTMLRVRFLLEWNAAYANKYPYALFIYQDDMIKNGWFDIYSEWLFGKAESVVQYNAWNTFHSDDMQRFDKWHVTHQLHPGAGQLYNSRNMKGLFSRKE